MTGSLTISFVPVVDCLTGSLGTSGGFLRGLGRWLMDFAVSVVVDIGCDCSVCVTAHVPIFITVHSR